MLYGFCSLPVVPMRAEASDRAEMVSQLLFGDTFVVEQRGEKWSLIVMDYDGYCGWVDTKQIYFLQEQEYNRVKAWNIKPTSLITTVVVGGMNLLLPMGCSLPSTAVSVVATLEIEHSMTRDMTEVSLLDIATKWLGVPYLWDHHPVSCFFHSQLFLLASVPQIRLSGNPIPSRQVFRTHILPFSHPAVLKELRLSFHNTVFLSHPDRSR